MFGKKRESKVSFGHWDLDETAEKVDLSEVDPSVGRRRAVVWIAIGVIIVGFFAFLARLGVDLSAPDASVEASQSARAVQAATTAMHQWLASTPAPLPGGQVVSVGAAPKVTIGSEGSSSKREYETRLVQFTLVDSSGQRYMSQVLVALDPRGSTSVLAAPSLAQIPADATDEWGPSTTWPDHTEVAITDAVQRAVAGWAAAYTSGDSDAMRTAVGDGDPQHLYTPLHGAAVAKVNATMAAQQSEQDPTVLMVRVELQVAWAQAPAAPDATYPTIMFDLLLERATTASPVVVAWGAPGTGPTLTRYGNAVDGTGRDPSATPSAPAAPQTPAVPPPATPAAQQVPSTVASGR